MANWDAAEEAIMNASCKIWDAFAVAWPSLEYGTGTWVTLNIDGQQIPCQCDCTGILIAIITYMGYDASHWPTGSTGGYGSGLAEATQQFIRNADGTISDDWVLIHDTQHSPKAGDIRGQDPAGGQSHADMFVGYDGSNCRGLNGGSTNSMSASAAAAQNYMRTGEFDLSQAAWTIQDGNYTTVLRYVKGDNTPISSTDADVATDTLSIKKLDIYLGLVNPGNITFNIMTASGTFKRVEPGYRSITEFGVDSNPPREATFVFSDLEQVVVWVGYRVSALADVKHRFYLLFTTDGSDPATQGRTVVQKSEGGRMVNDIEGSIGFGAYIKARIPFCIRALLKDAENDDLIQAAGTGYFTTQSDIVNDLQVSDYVNLMRQYFLNDLDATGRSPNAIDAHPQLYLNDVDNIVSAEPYAAVIPGLPGVE